MRKIGFFIILVIILVSINWFRVAQASERDPRDAELTQKLRHELSSQETEDQARHYQSARIYDDDELARPGTSDGTNRDDANLSQTSPPDGAVKIDQPPDQNPSLTRGPVPFETLQPFGREFFGLPADVTPPTDISAAADYRLGPGDNLVIYLWGRVEKEYDLTVDREGKVFVPTVGSIAAWGKTLADFSNDARRAFGTAYSEFDLSCSLGRVRTIRIYVAGEVMRPGAYTVSSLTSLFNALTMAGGPNIRGSMRGIKLMRQGKCLALVDLYRLLLEGDNSTDARLESGDVIFVPVVGSRVAVRGEVKRSAIYELLGYETAADVLKLAGAPTASAYLDRVMLERVSEHDQWEVLDLNLNPQKNSGQTGPIIRDGDRLTIYSIFEAKKDMVAVFGWVKHPGYYERTDTTYLSDLLLQVQLPDFDVYLDRANLYRSHPDSRREIIPINLRALLAGDQAADRLVFDRDSIHVYPNSEISRERWVYIEGAVNKPGPYLLYDGMNIADLIFLAGSFTREADRSQAELARIDDRGEVELSYIAINGADENNAVLTDEDHLFVRRMPDWRDRRTVTLEGKVRYPGKYVLTSDGETLFRMLQRAGGFTDDAFPTGLVLKRSSIGSDLNRLGLPDILDRTRELSTDSTGQIMATSEFDYNLGLLNRIIIDIDHMLATQGNEADVVLHPGDHIYVPPVPTGVSVMGAVGANGTLGFIGNRKVKDYIARSGGFTRQADKDETRLVRADGEVLSGGGVLKRKAQLGDIIVVPTRIEQRRDWGKTFTTVLSLSTGLLTSIYIVSKL